MFSSYKSYTSFICLFLTVLGLCCWAWALCASIVEAHGLSCCTACGIFLTRDWSHVSCSGRWIPIHCTTREVLWLSFLSSPFLPVFSSVQFSHSVVSDSLRSHGLYPARLLCPWNSLGKSTGVGWHSSLQGIFPTQGLNLLLPHCRQILYHLSYQGSPNFAASCFFKIYS